MTVTMAPPRRYIPAVKTAANAGRGGDEKNNRRGLGGTGRRRRGRARRALRRRPPAVARARGPAAQGGLPQLLHRPAEVRPQVEEDRLHQRRSAPEREGGGRLLADLPELRGGLAEGRGDAPPGDSGLPGQLRQDDRRQGEGVDPEEARAGGAAHRVEEGLPQAARKGSARQDGREVPPA